MRSALLVALLAASAVLAGCSSGPSTAPPPTVAATDPATDDVVVVAVVDGGFNPYHFDFLAGFMPQALNADPADDLPLDTDPALWVPGYANATGVTSRVRLDLTLTPGDAKAVPDTLHEKDAKEWSKVKPSDAGEVNLAWIPGTKVIGAVTFGSGDGYAAGSHGVGTSSVSVGNFHGTCPHCLLVFVDGTSEKANEWVAQQDWIDLQTNSWGFSTTVVGRERVYAHSDTELQREAVDRGQSIFFSAGNGIEGGYVATNPTLFSSQEGPDWITTVGAILPDGSITGAGKPADISAPGAGYDSAYGAATVNDTGEFGGTSNATPVTAGLYAEALYQIRRELAGASRVQKDGVVAQGDATSAACGPANAECALADGALTVHELRAALFRSANYTGMGYSQSALGPSVLVPTTENQQELVYLGAGHGSFWGRMQGDDQYHADVARIVGFAKGEWNEEQDADQAAWFVADSLCRQSGWGAWENGYATDAASAPGPSPDWPARTWLSQTCPQVLPAVIAAERQVPYAGDVIFGS